MQILRFCIKLCIKLYIYSYYSNFMTLLLIIHLVFHLTDTINLLTTEFSPIHDFSSDTTLLLLNKNQPTGIGLHPCPCSHSLAS